VSGGTRPDSSIAGQGALRQGERGAMSARVAALVACAVNELASAVSARVAALVACAVNELANAVSARVAALVACAVNERANAV
jgi:hypothetical protein